MFLREGDSEAAVHKGWERPCSAKRINMSFLSKRTCKAIWNWWTTFCYLKQELPQSFILNRNESRGVLPPSAGQQVGAMLSVREMQTLSPPQASVSKCLTGTQPTCQPASPGTANCKYLSSMTFPSRNAQLCTQMLLTLAVCWPLSHNPLRLRVLVYIYLKI